MNAFLDHLISLRDEALDAAMHARVHLTRVLEECEDSKFAQAMEQVAYCQPYARWWMRVTDEVEHGGLDPMAALTQARTAARRFLLQTRLAPSVSLFSTAQMIAEMEAIRRFYEDTAFFNLETITGPGPETPTVTGTPPAAPPGTVTPPTGPATAPTGPAARPAIGPAGPGQHPGAGPVTGPEAGPTAGRWPR